MTREEAVRIAYLALTYERTDYDASVVLYALGIEEADVDAARRDVAAAVALFHSVLVPLERGKP